jgi:PRTRC genetic system protein B
MDLHLSLGASERLTLTGAILVYRGARRSFAAWHRAVANSEGAPTLSEAERLSTEFLRVLSAGLGAYVAPEILPANVLVRNAETLVWWSLPQHRTLFFVEHADRAGALNGRVYPIPALVWKAMGRHLWVRALAESNRPDADTPLRTAPFWNINDSGEVCLGTMRIPGDSGLDSIAAWERGFFESEFTHASGASRLTTFPGGFIPLLESVAGSKARFPIRYLTEARETLKEFVERR